jgi:hypothetical protein
MDAKNVYFKLKAWLNNKHHQFQKTSPPLLLWNKIQVVVQSIMELLLSSVVTVLRCIILLSSNILWKSWLFSTYFKVCICPVQSLKLEVLSIDDAYVLYYYFFIRKLNLEVFDLKIQACDYWWMDNIGRPQMS